MTGECNINSDGKAMLSADGQMKVRLTAQCGDCACDPPPPPPGEIPCCKSDNSCEMLTYEECVAIGGTPVGGIFPVCPPSCTNLCNVCSSCPLTAAASFPDIYLILSGAQSDIQGLFLSPPPNSDVAGMIPANSMMLTRPTGNDCFWEGPPDQQYTSQDTGGCIPGGSIFRISISAFCQNSGPCPGSSTKYWRGNIQVTPISAIACWGGQNSIGLLRNFAGIGDCGYGTYGTIYLGYNPCPGIAFPIFAIG